MSASEPICLHNWRTGEFDHDRCEATVSTVGANHDILKQNHLLASVILPKCIE